MLGVYYVLGTINKYLSIQIGPDRVFAYKKWRQKEKDILISTLKSSYY